MAGFHSVSGCDLFTFNGITSCICMGCPFIASSPKEEEDFRPLLRREHLRYGTTGMVSVALISPESMVWFAADMDVSSGGSESICSAAGSTGIGVCAAKRGKY